MLEQHLKNKFPEFKVSLYVSKRKESIHLGLDISLFSFIRHDELIKEIKNFRMCLKTFQIFIPATYRLY